MENNQDPRKDALTQWLRDELGHAIDDLRLASSDASFRRYFRATLAQQSFIVMDAPPPMEDVRPFVKVAALLRNAGTQAPAVHAMDEPRGFLLLDDFGSDSYLDRLDPHSADVLYGDALNSLLRLQKGVNIQQTDLPPYDETLLRNEMNLFRDWFVGKLLGLHLAPDEQAILDQTWQILIDSALEQPSVCVHRDYHSRNLMVTEQDNPGVLDFQDAVIGPITYDLVSLLRDCYIAWPQERIDAWVNDYRLALIDHELLPPRMNQQIFMRWFDLMGVQRHLKAVGIFSRLKLRDGKSGYLGDIPRTLNYITGVAERYPELTDFLALLQQRILETAKASLGQAA